MHCSSPFKCFRLYFFQGRSQGFAALDNTGHLPQKLLPAGYGDYSAYDIGWYAFHFAAAAACRGSVPDGSYGYGPNYVYPQTYGRSCPQVCSMNKMQCNAQVTIMGGPRVTAEKKPVGSFYNYGCNRGLADSYWGEFRSSESAIFRAHPGWMRYCCCR